MTPDSSEPKAGSHDVQENDLLVAQVSHELRSPIHAVLGLVELVLDSPIAEEERGLLEALRSEALRLRSLIEDLLDYSAGRSGQFEVRPEPCRLAAVLDRLDQVVAPQLNEGVRLSIDLDPDIPELVSCDGNRLRQVILNLLSNAAKNTASGSVGVTIRWDAGTLDVDVTDTGRGIRSADLERIFGPYQRSDVESSIPGIGLGLTIARQILDAMGSGLRCTSEFGVGTRFYFSVAAPRLSLPIPETPAVTEDDYDAGGARVLVVDDSEINRVVIRRQLERLGAVVFQASSADEALALLAETRVDLILMDWHMPEVDGLQLTEMIRANPGPAQHTTIVGLTASALSGDRQRCLDAGMNDYLPKPAGLEQITAVLSRWLTPAEQNRSRADDPLNQLAADLGSISNARSLVSTYKDALSGLVEDLVAAIASGDRLRMIRAADSLAGPTETLRLHHLAAACTAVALDDGHSPEEWSSRLTEAARSGREQLTSWLQSQPTSDDAAPSGGTHLGGVPTRRKS